MDVDFLTKAAEQNIRLECVKIAAASKQTFSPQDVTAFADVLIKFITQTPSDTTQEGKGKI